MRGQLALYFLIVYVLFRLLTLIGCGGSGSDAPILRPGEQGVAPQREAEETADFFPDEIQGTYIRSNKPCSTVKDEKIAGDLDPEFSLTITGSEWTFEWKLPDDCTITMIYAGTSLSGNSLELVQIDSLFSEGCDPNHAVLKSELSYNFKLSDTVLRLQSSPTACFAYARQSSTAGSLE